jgi:hypothetical protein
MSKRLFIGAMAVLVISAPAFAATNYYVAHKPNDNTCTITQTKPDGKSTVMVGAGAHATQAAATAAMKTAADCKK